MKNIHIFLGLLFLIVISCKKEKTERPYGTLIEVPNEAASMYEAVKVAQAYDTILIYPDEYHDWNLTITKPLYITSTRQSEADSLIIKQTVINAKEFSRVFTIENCSDTVRLNGFTIKGGLAKKKESNPTVTDWYGGGIYCHNSNMVVSNMIITDNMAEEDNSQGTGGGIYLNKSGVIFDKVKITDNDAMISGGGINCNKSTLYIKNSTIENNTVSLAGSPLNFIESFLNISNTVFRNNPNPLWGYADITITDCHGIFKQVSIENDSLSLIRSTINMVNCSLPDYSEIDK